MKILLYVIGFIVFCFAGFFLVGFVVPRVEYGTELQVNRSVAQSWTVFTSPELTGQWMEGFQKFEKIKGEPLSAGSEFFVHIRENGQDYRALEKVEKVITNKEYTILLQNELFEDRVIVKFDSTAPYSTKMQSIHQMQAKHWFMRSLFVFLKSSFKQRDEATMLKLKNLIELDPNIKPTNK